MIHYLPGVLILSCGRLLGYNVNYDKCLCGVFTESETGYFPLNLKSRNILFNLTDTSHWWECFIFDLVCSFLVPLCCCFCLDLYRDVLTFLVSGSNLATHIVGSLKKGKSLTPIPPTTYNTLPSSHLSQHRTISEGMISASPNLSLPPTNNNHKRSPSSDSGNPGSRSTTPVSYHLSKLHGKCLTWDDLIFCPHFSWEIKPCFVVHCYQLNVFSFSWTDEFIMTRCVVTLLCFWCSYFTLFTGIRNNYWCSKT